MLGGIIYTYMSLIKKKVYGKNNIHRRPTYMQIMKSLIDQPSLYNFEYKMRQSQKQVNM